MARARISPRSVARGKYNLCLGTASDGSPLDKPYREGVGHDEVGAALTALIELYALERDAGQRFGDFVIRTGCVAATTTGRYFHAHLAA